MDPGIYKELLSKVPRTFVPSLNEQFRRWDFLFPSAQRTLKAQLDWLAGLSGPEFKKLFAPLIEVESRMELPNWQPQTVGIGIEDAGMLARSPHYGAWRTEVAKVFTRIDEATAGLNPLAHIPRLLVCSLPSGLPIESELWPDLATRGQWLALAEPPLKWERSMVAVLARRRLPAGMEDVEGTWIVECSPRFSAGAGPGAVAISWERLAAVRRVFLSRLNAIQRDLKSADRTAGDLDKMDLAGLLGSGLGDRPRVREFIRKLLLSGNGSLVFNNSFTEWGAAEALLAAQPQMLVAGFGIRPKLKPFSSTVLFEDQHRNNPTQDEDDLAGSLIDGQMLSQYVYYSSQREACYQDHALTLFMCADLPRLLVLGPKEPVPGLEALLGPLTLRQKIASGDLTDFLLKWLET
jgi:hypothetical protein